MSELLVSALLLLGTAFVAIGSIGLARMPDLFTRLHAPTKATTLGLGALVIASILFHSTNGDGLSLKDLAISLFLFITAPVVGHVLAKAALRKPR